MNPVRYSATALLLSLACSAEPAPLNGVDAGRDGGPIDVVEDAGVNDAGSTSTCDEVDDMNAFITLGLFGCNAMEPGTTRDFDLYLGVCCYFDEPLSACETWHIDPPTAGVTVDAQGLVTVDASVPPGTIFDVVATFGDGTNRFGSATVDVYSKVRNPLSGGFHEVARLDCGDGHEYEYDALHEVAFCGPLFSVTRNPFETYKDYWGRWDFDPTTGAIAMTVSDGNFIPENLDLEGTLRMEGSDIVVDGVWLGDVPTTTVACGHRLSP